MSTNVFEVKKNPIADRDINFADKDVVVFSHTDCFDGTVAAYLVSTVVGWGQCASCEVIYGGYDKEVPLLPRQYKNKPIVFIVDYSFENIHDIIALAEQAEHVVWLDHHETAYKILLKSGIEEFPTNLHIELSSHYSGALLVSRFFNCDGAFNTIAVHVDDHDRHQHVLGEPTKIICDMLAMYGMDDPSSVDKVLTRFVIPYVVNDLPSARASLMVEMRELTINYKTFLERSIKDYVKTAFIAEVDGEFFVATMAPRGLRGPVNAAMIERYDANVAAIISPDKEILRVSLRSVDNGRAMQLAEKWGGGGHPNAAGVSIPYEYLKTHPLSLLNM